MLHPTSAAPYSYLYPIGDTPPSWLTRSLPPEQDADILLLGCGDAKDILFTLQQQQQQQMPRRLDITCCDLEPVILARNILLFALLLDKGYKSNIDKIWNIYYHWKVDKGSHALLKSKTMGLTKVSESMDKWHNSNMGKCLRFCNSATLRDVRDVWLHWLGLPDAVFNEDVAKFHAEQYQEMKKRHDEKSKSSISIGILRSAAPVISEASNRLENLGDDYHKDGGIFDNARAVTKAEIPNPTMFATGKRRSILHYDTQPFLGFHLAPCFTQARRDQTKQTDEITEHARAITAAKDQFKSWSDAFQSAIAHSLTTIRFFAGDALALANTLQAMAQDPAKRTAHVKSHPWTFETLTLDSHDYLETGPAPTMFDVIDTSNLLDHVGALNLLMSASPLLKPRIQSSLFTETTIQHYRDPKERNRALLYGHFDSVSKLLGLTVVENWTNATLAPETDEAIYDTISKKLELSPSHHQQVTRQCWKRLNGFGMFKQTADPIAVASILSDIFKSMFRYEEPAPTVSGPKAPLAELPHYTRLSFAALVKFLKKNISTNMERVSVAVLGQLGLTNSWSMYDRYNQELYVGLCLLGIDVVDGLESLPDKAVSPGLDSWIRDWTALPPLVCVCIQVPRKHLTSALLARAPLRKPNPMYCLSLESVLKPDESPKGWKPWSRCFRAVQVGYGTITSSKESSWCLVEEDPAGIHGTSDLIVSAFIPTINLGQDRGNFNVEVRLQCTRLDTASYCPILSTEDSTILFRAHLTDTTAVRLSATWPEKNNTAAAAAIVADPSALKASPDLVKESWPKYLAKEMAWRAPGELQGVRHEPTAVVILRSQFIGGPLETAHFGLPLEAEYRAETALPDTDPKHKVVSPFDVDITLRDLAPLKIKFPFPISDDIQLKKSTEDILVTVKAAGLHQRLSKPSLLLPMSMSDSGQVLLWTAPYIALDKQPPIDRVARNRKLRTKYSWIEMVVRSMFSDREVGLEQQEYQQQRQQRRQEQQLRQQQQTQTRTANPDMRLDFKRHLSKICLLPLGLQHYQSKTRRHIFTLARSENEGEADVQFVIVVSKIRVDLSARSVVADAVVIPILPEMAQDPVMLNFITRLPVGEAQRLIVSAAGMKLWKHALPVFAERCRTWSHAPGTCEYLAHNSNANGNGKIPPASMLAKCVSPLCSCGKGKLPADYGFVVRDPIPHIQYAMSHHGTRVALSPVFPVTYLEECTGRSIAG